MSLSLSSELIPVVRPKCDFDPDENSSPEPPETPKRKQTMTGKPAASSSDGTPRALQMPASGKLSIAGQTHVSINPRINRVPEDKDVTSRSLVKLSPPADGRDSRGCVAAHIGGNILAFSVSSSGGNGGSAFGPSGDGPKPADASAESILYAYRLETKETLEIGRFPGTIIRLDFARLRDRILLAAVTDRGDISVHEVFGGKEMSRRVLMIEYRQERLSHASLSWAPYVPMPDENPGQEQEAKLMLAVTRDGKVILM